MIGTRRGVAIGRRSPIPHTGPPSYAPSSNFSAEGQKGSQRIGRGDFIHGYRPRRQPQGVGQPNFLDILTELLRPLLFSTVSTDEHQYWFTSCGKHTIVSNQQGAGLHRSHFKLAAGVPLPRRKKMVASYGVMFSKTLLVSAPPCLIHDHLQEGPLDLQPIKSSSPCTAACGPIAHWA